MVCDVATFHHPVFNIMFKQSWLIHKLLTVESFMNYILIFFFIWTYTLDKECRKYDCGKRSKREKQVLRQIKIIEQAIKR